jgi:hypothetical protein
MLKPQEQAPSGPSLIGALGFDNRYSRFEEVFQVKKYAIQGQVIVDPETSSTTEYNCAIPVSITGPPWHTLSSKRYVHHLRTGNHLFPMAF